MISLGMGAIGFTCTGRTARPGESPSGRENIYKIYTESFLGREHLTRIQEEARAIVNEVFTG